MNKDALSLSVLMRQVKAAISMSFPDGVWVLAEIYEMNVNRGHCYMELVEKSDGTDQIVAKTRATIWANVFRMLKPYFETTTGYRFEAGIKLMLKVNPEMHEQFGFSLNVRDLDPNYTLGDVARRKQEIVAQLEQDGVINLNKELFLPVPLKRLAIISSATAAGYGDFMNQLQGNEYGFVYSAELFESLMQGNQAVESILKALDAIFEREDEFDAVVLIRGGGSKSDLAAFDEYELAYHLAQFPIPVLTGIGHDRDESIADLVAHKVLKTPTAVAEFLIEQSLSLANRIEDMQQQLYDASQSFLEDRKQKLEKVSNKLVQLSIRRTQAARQRIEKLYYALHLGTQQHLQQKRKQLNKANKNLYTVGSEIIHQNRQRIGRLQTHLVYKTERLLQQKHSRLTLAQKSILHLDPNQVLKRGFTTTYLDGKLVKHMSELEKGKIIVTNFQDGNITSEVQ